MQPTVFITGGAGQAGLALQRHAAAKQYTLLAPARDALDLTNTAATTAFIAEHKPDFVINCAAYTAVDKAEIEQEAAFLLNETLPETLAKSCTAHSIPLLHLSTDYVFDGMADMPYNELNPTNPMSVYGHSKLAGEWAIHAHCRHHLIMRTSWVFSADRSNFVKTMLKLAETRPHLSVVQDQRGCPTSADSIAGALWQMVEHLQQYKAFDDWGTYHFCGTPATNWYKFAGEIFTQAVAQGMLTNAPTVTPIPTTAYPTPAKRPAFSMLDCEKIRTVFGITQRDWRVELGVVLGNLQNKILGGVMTEIEEEK
jgi:dTDP-4-dehydrorhamnose reductase